MMLKEYEIRCYVKPINKLDSCLRLEGMDPLYIRSIEKKKREQKNLSMFIRVVERLLGKWIRRMEISKVPDPR